MVEHEFKCNVMNMNELKNLLKEIKHPEINMDLVGLGMIGRVKEEDNKVTVELKLPFLNIPIKQMLINQIRGKLDGRVVNVKPCLMSNEDKAEFFVLARKHWAL